LGLGREPLGLARPLGMGRESLGVESWLGLGRLGLAGGCWSGGCCELSVVGVELLLLRLIQRWLWLPLQLRTGSRCNGSCHGSSGRDRAPYDRPERGGWPGADGKLLHHACENLPAHSRILGWQWLFVPHSRRTRARFRDAVTCLWGQRKQWPGQSPAIALSKAATQVMRRGPIARWHGCAMP
jgi:hypothetical protein